MGLGALTDGERYHFDLYGYVVRRGALSPAELAHANDAVCRLEVPRPGADIASQRFVGFLDRDQIFRDLIDHDAVLDPVIELCGPTVRLDHAYGIAMTKGTEGLALHGGGTPHDPAQFYEVRGGRIFNGLVAAQWALVDHDRGHGGFVCVPGSHRANFTLPAGAGDGLSVHVPMWAGDLVIFTEALTHGTAPWTADHDRRALLYKYAPGHACWGVQYTTTLKALGESGLLTPRQQRLVQIPAVHPHQPVSG